MESEIGKRGKEEILECLATRKLATRTFSSQPSHQPAFERRRALVSDQLISNFNLSSDLFFGIPFIFIVFCACKNALKDSFESIMLDVAFLERAGA